MSSLVLGLMEVMSSKKLISVITHQNIQIRNNLYPKSTNKKLNTKKEKKKTTPIL